MEVRTPDVGPSAAVRTFLIVDVRGYTRFTREHGDAEAARLAKRFADLARDGVEARSGRVIELRGDEALAVFTSTAQAVRAALELQAAYSEETAADPSLPLAVGIGIDVGEAVPVEDGFRGVALNTAARLCSKAEAGQVLVTRAVADLAQNIEEVRFEGRGQAELKGFEMAIDLFEAASVRVPLSSMPTPGRGASTIGEVASLPPELEPLTPMVDREQQMHWVRGTWRQARRGYGRVVFVSGPSQIGKTRLAAEAASEVIRSGGLVRYAGPGGAATALAIAAIRDASSASQPTLVVLDDLDVAGEEAAGALDDLYDQIRSRPVLVMGLVKDPDAGPALAAVVAEADRLGDGHVRLSGLDLDGIEGITRLYVGDGVRDAPLESMARASGGIPGRVHEVVSEWARDEAGRRLAAAAEWLAEGRERRSTELEFANNVIGLKLGRLYAGDAQVEVDPDCPYKGLASFEEADAAYFFGRERLVGELAARTVQVGLLGVVGASGSGKSSVVAAGLLPSLRAGLLPGSERWRHVVFRPGEHPLAELAAALDRASLTAGGGLQGSLEAMGDDGRLVVAVDQFEEVFTLCSDEVERDAFISTITEAAIRSPERIVFVLTIRDDFYGRCAPYRELADLLVTNHVLVPPMTAEELRRAIELPARRARLRVEAGLADTLVAEAAEEPGALPLLSVALVELWQAREDGWIRADDHERTGGIRGAVARLAEASYQQLSGSEQDVARRILLRLAGVSEGDTPTRRRVDLSEFDVGTDPLVADVLGRLTEDRLLTMSASTVEVAHEALLREWPRLRGWLEEDVQGHQLREHLTHAAKQWMATDRDPSELYRGARLSAALDWAAARGPDLNELERAFLAEGRQASEREAERQRRTNRRLRGLLVGTAVFLVFAVLAGGIALVQRGNARAEARVATSRELAAAAVANLDVDPERAILLAIEAVDATWEADGTAVPEAEEALHRALERSRVVLTVDEGGALAVSGDGSRFATTRADGTATVWETDAEEPLMTLEGHEGAINGIAFSPDDRTLATAGADGRVRLWDGASGRQIDVLRVKRRAVLSVVFSPDGSRIATIVDDSTVVVWDVATGREEMVLGDPSDEGFFVSTLEAEFSPDGARLVAPRPEGTAVVWDLSSGEPDVVLPIKVWQISDAAFSPDGHQIATGNAEGVIRIWDAQSGDDIATFFGHTGEIWAIGYSPDGSRIATGGSDATARVWDAETGKPLLTLAGHTSEVLRVAFTPDGDRLLTGGADRTTRMWDISVRGGRDWLTVPGPDMRFAGVAFSPDGATFAVPNQISGVAIRSVDTGEKLMTLRGGGMITRMAFSPDGTRLAGAAGSGASQVDANRTVPIWDVRTGKLLMTLQGHEDEVTAVAFSPDGSSLVTGSMDGELRVWNAATGVEERALDVSDTQDDYPMRLAFSADGRLLLAGMALDGAVPVFDAETFEQRRGFRGHTKFIQDAALGPRGLVATASGDGTARIWDLESDGELATLRGHRGWVNGVAISPDGSLVATAGADGTVKLWDTATGGEVLTLFGHDRIVSTVAFSPDGRLVASVSGDGTVRLHLLPIDELRELARTRVTRTLTPEECRQYLHDGSCPTAD